MESIGFISLTWCMDKTDNLKTNKFFEDLLKLIRDQNEDQTIVIHTLFTGNKKFDREALKVNDEEVIMHYVGRIPRDDTVEIYLKRPTPEDVKVNPEVAVKAM